MSQSECVRLDEMNNAASVSEKSSEKYMQDNLEQKPQLKYKPSDDSEPEKTQPRLVTWKGVVMYGICVILANHFSDWTIILNAGFWEAFGAMLIVGSATGCLMLCVAEMTAALPFSGGTYGVVRVTLGDFPGYLVGTCEALQIVLYVTFNIAQLGRMVTIMTGYDDKYEPLYWAIIYISIGVISMNYRLLFWRSVWVFGVYICVILLLYCTMTRTGDVDFAKYTKDSMVESESNGDHLYRFFEQLANGSFFFNLYVKVSPLACRECKNPTTDVPLAMYIVYALAIMSAFSVLFCMSSIFPGVAVLRRSPGAPMSFGISSMFHIAMERAVAFTFLAKYATCLVLVFAFTQQMAALSKSGFLWNSRKWGCVPDRADRLVGLLVGCGFGYLLNIMILYWNEDIRHYIINGFKMLGYSINMTVFVTYIVFRQKFPSLMKKFRSPLGVAGAVYGLLVYIMIWSCIGALNDMGDHWRPFVLLACFLVLWSLPFVLYYRHHLTFSEEESSVLFVAYVIKANQARRLQRQTGCVGGKSYSPESSSRSHQFSRSMRSNRRASRATSTNSSNAVELSLSISRVHEEEGEEEGEVGEDQKVLTAVPTQTATTEQGIAPTSTSPAADNPRTRRPSGDSTAGTTRLPYMRRIVVSPPNSNSSRDSRVFPVESSDDGESEDMVTDRNRRRTSSVVQVLTRELGYEAEMMGQISTEIDEYYGASAQQRRQNKHSQQHTQARSPYQEGDREEEV